MTIAPEGPAEDATPAPRTEDESRRAALRRLAGAAKYAAPVTLAMLTFTRPAAASP